MVPATATACVYKSEDGVKVKDGEWIDGTILIDTKAIRLMNQLLFKPIVGLLLMWWKLFL